MSSNFKILQSKVKIFQKSNFICHYLHNCLTGQLLISPTTERARQTTKKTTSVRFTFHEKKLALNIDITKIWKLALWNDQDYELEFKIQGLANPSLKYCIVKYRYSEKATKIWNNLTIYLNMNWDIVSNFCGLLRISELYCT